MRDRSPELSFTPWMLSISANRASSGGFMSTPVVPGLL
jgi:hypothetical protein